MADAPPDGRALFDTALGPMGIAWSGDAIVAAMLPELDATATERRLARRTPTVVTVAIVDAPEFVQRAVARVQGVLLGERDDLRDIPVRMSGVSALHARVYEVARRIRPGETLTYGEVAERLGDRSLARAVGEALGRNPVPVIVPCHRVVAASGTLGGFSAPGGAETKRKLLQIEGAAAASQLGLFGG